MRVFSTDRIYWLVLICLLAVSPSNGQESFSKTAGKIARALEQKDSKALATLAASIDPTRDLFQNETNSDELRRAIEGIPPDTKEGALNEAFELLRNEPGKARDLGVALVGSFGQYAKSRVESALSDQDPRVKSGVIVILPRIGWDANVAVPRLISIIEADQNSEVKVSAFQVLTIYGPAASGARAIALESIENSDAKVRGAAAFALGGIYSDTRRIGLEWSDAELGPVCEALVRHLRIDEPDGITRATSAAALGQIKGDLGNRIPALIAALHDPEPDVRAAAAYAIGVPNNSEAQRKTLLTYAEAALKVLIPILSTPEENISVKKAAVSAISTIAFDASLIKDTRPLDQLKVAQQVAAQNTDPLIKSYDRLLEPSIQSLEKEKTYQKFFWVKYLLIVFAAYAVLLLVCLTLLFMRPLWLLRINNSLLFLDEVKLPEWLGGLKIPLRYFVLMGFFHYHPRVLDAWVASKVNRARTRFQSLDTVKDRSIYIPVPVFLDDRVVPELEPKDLRPLFNQDRCCLLINGEGGGGKTSIACRIALWAMSGLKEERVADQAMLPVLLEQELDYQVPADKSPLTEAIHGRLRAIVGDAQDLTEELLNRLLLHRRVLVIIDHFSELSETTQAKIRPGARDFPAHAFVVTSRLEEALDQVPKTVIKPLRVEGNRLSSFMESYLLRRCKEHTLFSDAEKFDSYSRLSAMVGDRDVTILLAKLFAEQMIALKRSVADGRYINTSLPTNIPDLMLSFLNELSRDVQSSGFDGPSIHQAARITAWYCLKDSFRPSQARIADVLNGLAEVGNNKEMLDYLEKKLRIIQTLEPGREHVRFTLDPLAEYLGAMRLIEMFDNNDRRWEGFLNRADATHGAPASIKEFMLAIRDCCMLSSNQTRVPAAIPDELGKRAGFDPETIKRAQRSQRIQRMITVIGVPEVEDRIFAVRTIGLIGPDAVAALPHLIDVLKRDSCDDVRAEAAISLGRVGVADPQAVIPVLTDALKDSGPATRSAVYKSLSILGTVIEDDSSVNNHD